jgi:hypothetical protein
MENRNMHLLVTCWTVRLQARIPPYLDPPTSGWSYRPASYRSLGKMRLSGLKNVSQFYKKPLWVLHTFILIPILHA